MGKGQTETLVCFHNAIGMIFSKDIHLHRMLQRRGWGHKRRKVRGDKRANCSTAARGGSSEVAW